MSKPRQIRHAWIPKTVLLVLIVAMGWVGWYFYRRGFTREWRNFLVHELREQGIEVTVNRMTLDPFRGLIVHGVVIYDSPERRWILAEFDRATLDVSIPAMLREKPFINGIDFRDATIVVPIDSRDKSAAEIKITECWAKLYFLVGSVALRRAEGKIEGIRFAASGTAIHGGRIDISGEPPLAEANALARSFISYVHALEWDHAPQLVVEFSVAADNPNATMVDATFVGSKLAWGYSLADSIEIKAKIEGNHLLLDRARWVVGSKEIRLQGSCNIAAGTAWFHLESELHPGGLLKNFAEDYPIFNYIDFEELPRITAEGELWKSDIGGLDWKVTGDFDAPKAGFRSLQLEHLSGSFAWERDRWFIKKMQFENGAGMAQGDAMYENGRLKLRVESEVDPRIFNPFLDKKLAEAMNAWSFSRPPWIALNTTGEEAPDQLIFSGEAVFGRCEYQGQSYRSAHAKFQISKDQIKYNEMDFD